MRRKIAILAGLAALSIAAPESKATAILVGQCLEFSPCFNTGASWIHTLSASDLASLGLGKTVPLVVAQTSQFEVHLGVTTIAFFTPFGPLIQTLPEFNGPTHLDPCHFCEIDTIGLFSIPFSATRAVIAGRFGSTSGGASAGANVYLGPFVVTPEPASFGILSFTLAGFFLCARLRRSVN